MRGGLGPTRWHARRVRVGLEMLWCGWKAGHQCKVFERVPLGNHGSGLGATPSTHAVTAGPGQVESRVRRRQCARCEREGVQCRHVRCVRACVTVRACPCVVSTESCWWLLQRRCWRRGMYGGRRESFHEHRQRGEAAGVSAGEAFGRATATATRSSSSRTAQQHRCFLIPATHPLRSEPLQIGRAHV